MSVEAEIQRLQDDIAGYDYYINEGINVEQFQQQKATTQARINELQTQTQSQPVQASASTPNESTSVTVTQGLFGGQTTTESNSIGTTVTETFEAPKVSSSQPLISTSVPLVTQYKDDEDLSRYNASNPEQQITAFKDPETGEKKFAYTQELQSYQQKTYLDYQAGNKPTGSNTFTTGTKTTFTPFVKKEHEQVDASKRLAESFDDQARRTAEERGNPEDRIYDERSFMKKIAEQDYARKHIDFATGFINEIPLIPAKAGMFIESLGITLEAFGINLPQQGNVVYDELGNTYTKNKRLPIAENKFFAEQITRSKDRADYEYEKYYDAGSFIGGVATAPITGQAIFPSLSFTTLIDAPFISSLDSTSHIKNVDKEVMANSKTQVEITYPKTGKTNTETILSKQVFEGVEKTGSSYRVETIGIVYGRNQAITQTSTIITPSQITPINFAFDLADDVLSYSLTPLNTVTVKGSNMISSTTLTRTQSGVTSSFTTGTAFDVPQILGTKCSQVISNALNLPSGQFTIFKGNTNGIPTSSIMRSTSNVPLHELTTITEVTEINTPNAVETFLTRVKLKNIFSDSASAGVKTVTETNLLSNVASAGLQTTTAPAITQTITNTIPISTPKGNTKTTTETKPITITVPTTTTNTKTKTVPTTTTNTKTKTVPATKSRSQLLSLSKIKTLSLEEVNSKTKIFTNTGQTQISSTITEEIVIPIVKPPITIPNITPTPIGITPPPPPIIKFPPFRGLGGNLSVGTGGKRTRPTRIKRSTRKSRYAPSLASIMFNIRGKKPNKKFLTGLENRPILGKKVKKKTIKNPFGNKRINPFNNRPRNSIFKKRTKGRFI